MNKYNKASVLIVENRNGDVFIVESKDKQKVGQKMIKTEIEKSDTGNSQNVIEYDENSGDVKMEEPDEGDVAEDLIVEEYLDEYYEAVDEDEFEGLSFVDSTKIKKEEVSSSSTMPSAILDHQYTVVEIGELGNDHDESEIVFEEYETYGDEEEEEEEVADGEMSAAYDTESESRKRSKKQYHKFHQLTGKAACKYCETLFKSKDLLRMHVCKYLQCDPKNFICRICGKELSKKTFSNHLHETLDCQYCGKKFINPRNLKAHIQKIHKGESFVPPKSPNRSFYKELNIDETQIQRIRLDEETGVIVTADEKEKKKYVRKRGRFECDLCGRVFGVARALTQHLLLHTKEYQYVCETCGEKFTTKTGIIKHSCLNRKRKRPEVDFRTVDVRHCRYCDLWFNSLEENKAHDCQYQVPYDPKMFRCRFCMLEMSKNSYNKHMTKHLDANEYICKLCDKKLACEKALVTHLTTHSGNKPFQCDYCDKSFINKTLLIRHSRFHGIDVPTFRCEICDREVASKYHLKTHMMMHKDEVQCQICKEQFSNRDKLKEHYQTSHEPYPCGYCNKTFVLLRYLKMHEKLHKGDNTQQYSCEFCARNFSKRSLANHVYKNHSESFSEWRDRNMDFII